VDLDDFTGKFCCQGHFPLIRTVKSILENNPEWMPKEDMCPSCPTEEYKEIKKKSQNNGRKRRRRRDVSEVCKEKGDGVWADPTDCRKYFVCRSMTTDWAEKKHEMCYVGSYFDEESGAQCKWVGEGNYDCDKILGKDKKGEDDVKKEDKDDENEEDDDYEDEATAATTITTTERSGGNDQTKMNPQKIFYTSNKKRSETMIPESLYTCPAG
jgi:hypothetical protein